MAVVLPSACVALAVSGCGGQRQDVHEPAGRYAVAIVQASFPRVQSIARPVNLILQVRNLGLRTIPNMAVTVDSFSYTSTYPELASSKRPIWVIEQGPGPVATAPAIQSAAISPPGGGLTAFVNTWALGPLPPRVTQTFAWRVAPVKAGLHTVHYVFSAGLNGKAKAVLITGAPAIGQFSAYVTQRPPSRHVNPATGRVVPGPFPLVP